MNACADSLGFQIDGTTAESFENLMAYREGRIDGCLHARTKAGLARVARLPLVAAGECAWCGESGEWYVRGYCDSLRAYDVSS